MPASNPLFSKTEYANRQTMARTGMADLGYDGLLLFKIEDIYWLNGHESDGFCIFSCGFLGADADQMTLLVRGADLAVADQTSVCEDVRLSPDGVHQSRVDHIRDMLASHGMQGKRVGIQVATMGLTPQLYLEIAAGLEGWCTLIPAPDFIRELRLVKSPAELDLFRKAGRVMDDVMDEVVDSCQSGAFEGDIYARFYDGLFRRGADLPAHIPPLGGGEKAMNLRYTSGRGHIGQNDQITLELGLAWRRYHAASMCVVLTGPDINPRHLKMHETSVAALEAVQAKVTAGNTVGDLFAAYRDTLVARGEEDAVLTVCGYTMGAAWPPTWMEQPLIYEGNPLVLQENMVFFTHMILNDRETGLSMAVAEQAIVTSGAPEIITHVSKQPVIRP
ncbi:MAG: M24 family metallopeptidase [Roseovarius sp.]